MRIQQLWLTQQDLEFERRQCLAEGLDITEVEAEFNRLTRVDLDVPENQRAAEALLDSCQTLPIRADYPYHEPSDWHGIRRALPDPVELPPWEGTDEALLDKLHGAWVGRSCGCLLGKPVEGWKKSVLVEYLHQTGQFPLSDYISIDVADDLLSKFKIDRTQPWRENLTHMPEDDDLNYTTLALLVAEKHGLGFQPNHIAAAWLNFLPIERTFTAERIAYRNFMAGIGPPESASRRNPCREWIGAQIRAEFWGYVSPGAPKRAAEFSYKDATVSHVKNGIYGEIWAAAMVAASFTAQNLPTIVNVGLSQIPAQSRLAEAIRLVVKLRDEGRDQDFARGYALASLGWEDDHLFDNWCHTIPNAIIVAVALLWGEGDFERSIGMAVDWGFDTDCNAATVGSILGAMHGRKQLPRSGPIELATLWRPGLPATKRTA